MDIFRSSASWGRYTLLKDFRPFLGRINKVKTVNKRSGLVCKSSLGLFTEKIAVALAEFEIYVISTLINKM